ncbi:MULTISPECIES: ABC-three component system protein [unclassified Clostridium]|uniref:ABC-three component system protein n=1 Tax=unclassified Clostridium TaxID=2614128 RepID=UPI0002983ECA|nr:MULTISPECIES: ABC-three component system protein [unclassified Clostridium]EKQ55881.1 MAG: hypothetical protein A370_02454 [Clostridium sp. Maddingley MBC34-26]
MSVCDASSSWSGYQYQGKITIYIALQLINKCVKNPSGMNVGKYFIEVEHREDLAIKKENEYISFHQVKARKSDIYMNNYLEAIDKLYDEKIKSPNADIFLHTIVNIKDWSEEKYKDLYKSKVDKDMAAINLIEEEKSKLTDAKAIKENNEKIDKIKDAIKYNQSKYDESNKINSIILRKYGAKDDKFCTLGGIKVYIENEIKEYLSYTNQDEKLGNIDVAYNKLICYMDEYIKKRHAGEVKEYFAVKEIKDILDMSYLDRDRLFHLSKIKDIYCSISIENYCSNFCHKREKCNVEYYECRIYELIEHLVNIDLDDLEKIIMKFNPHVLIKDWEYDVRSFVEEDGVHFLYQTIISHIDKELFISNDAIKYDKAGLSYLPTTIDVISENRKKSAIETYKKAINNNEFLLNELFEDNVFITENLVSENILESINDVDEVDDILAKEQEEYNYKSYLVNQICFKNIEKVREELNND